MEYLKTSKEEFYENGKLVSYYHYTFIDINGRLEIETREELKDGKTTKVDYDYDESGKIIADTTFENGEKVSTASYIYDDNSELRRITTLGTDGKIIEIRESDDGSGYDEVYRYEYHANGKLKLKTMWHAVLARPETLVQKTEYNENGAVTLEEWYDRYSALTKKNTYVYLADGRLDYIETEENGTVSKTHCRYGEDGKLLKKETISGGYPTAYTDFIYYENGVLKEEITYDLLKSRQEGVKTYDESGRLIKECGRPSKKAPGTDYVWGDEFTYTYGEDGRVTEKCHKNINQIDLWIERYEYHANGEVSVLKTYWKNKAGEERENDTQYFDENGYEIYNW